LSELQRRVLFALVAAPLFIALIHIGGVIFSAVIWVICMLIHRETIGLMKMQGFAPNAPMVYVFGTAILSAGVFPDYAGVVLLLVLVMLVSVETLSKYHRQMFRLMSTLLSSVYPGVTLLTFIMIRDTAPDDLTGFIFILTLLFMIWGNDSLAYFGGRTFGRHLMAPHLSPKKTWEGFVFGFSGAALGLYLVTLIYPDSIVTMPKFWPLIFLISIFGPIGDLTASKLKRAAGAKDSSNLLPGHGGFLDRFDSILLASPVMYIYLRLFIL
jgi:phosphatidate cytidylyltransferase